MRAPRLEVAEVFRLHQDDYLRVHSASPQQRRVLRDIVACRTAALGAHLRRCDVCGHEEIAYIGDVPSPACRNRHCPKCQAQKQAAWLEAQCANLLEVPYYHVVFTLPEELGPLALQNKSLLYGLLFRSPAETLLTIARDPKHLGARIGFTAVLHTWGQTLLHHPHVHCVVPAGGLSPECDRWISARERFFLPVRVLSRLFRKKYLAYLREAFQDQRLVLAGRLADLIVEGACRAFLEPLERKEWIVYAKPPFGSSEQVLKYLARYTHRVAISNRRVLALRDGFVAFRYRNYRRGRTQRVMRLEATEFIRSFLLHVLPKRFIRIRHYGLLSNRARTENLALCRQLLMFNAATAEHFGSGTLHSYEHGAECPVCKQGRLLFVALMPPSRAGPQVTTPTLCYV